MFYSVRKVFLMLGSACNFKCRYCIQNNVNYKPLKIKTDVLDKVKETASVKAAAGERLLVMPWGGEPLLYIKEIKQIVEYLGDSVDYSIVTNGSLLTEEIVEFFNENNIKFVLSCDGRNTVKTRLNNMLENERFLELYKQLKHKSVDCVVSAYTQDIYDVWEYFNSIDPQLQVSFEFLQCTWDMPADIYNFDVRAFKETMKRIAGEAKDGLLSGVMNKQWFFIELMVRRIMANKKLDIPNCGQIVVNMNVDTEGNVYACHNISEKIGTIEDFHCELVEKYKQWLSEKDWRGDCRECQYVYFCNGDCPNTDKKTAGQKKCCEIRKVFIQTCIDFIDSFAGLCEEVELDVEGIENPVKAIRDNA